MKNIEKYLHLEEVDHWELMNVLLRHFFQAENPSPFVTKYQAKNSPHGLWVTSNENGKIENIKFSDGFPKEQLKQIEQKIKDDLLTKEQATGAEVLFCPERITGYFKYKDFFQIIPVPDGSPMPIIGVKDYPFLVQFRYTKSSNMIIDYSRRREKATIYSRLLNLLLNQRVKLMRNNAQAYWTLDVDEAANRISSSYRQEGYTFEGLSLVSSSFTDISGVEVMEKIPFQKYYTNIGMTRDPLKIPDNIEQSLDRVFSLSSEDYDRFFRACTWYEKGQEIWNDSASSSFVALVSAIETLVGEKTICNTCKQDIPDGLLFCGECKQPRYQVTKHFREFLVQHVSDLDTMHNEAAILYSTRSSLAHGVRLFQQDFKPWSFMNPIQQNEGQIQRNLFHITGIAIYKWLWKRNIK